MSFFNFIKELLIYTEDDVERYDSLFCQMSSMEFGTFIVEPLFHFLITVVTFLLIRV